MQPINPVNGFNEYLNRIKQILSTETSEAQKAERVVNYLNLISSNLNKLEKDKVAPLAKSLLEAASVLKTSDIAISTINRVSREIFNISFSNGRNFIHQLAKDGDYRGVQALVQLDALKASQLKSRSDKLALDYARNAKPQNEGHKEIISLFTHIHPELRVNNIVCTKGKDANAKDLLLNMRALRLKNIRRYSHDDVTYYFTRTFQYKQMFDDRPLIFAFVEKEGKLYPRLFWLSNSQAVWRRVDKLFGGGWIGKTSKGEERLALPIDVNLVVFELHMTTEKNGEVRSLDEKLGKIFIKRIVSWSEKSSENITPPSWMPRKNTDDSSLTSLDATSASDAEDDSNKEIIGPSNLPPNPLHNDLKIPFDRPNFSRVIKQSNILSPLYGDLIARVFLSQNERIKYLFLENTSRHVFLACAQLTKVSINKKGIPEQWLATGSLSLPLKEYPKQFRVDRNFYPNEYKRTPEDDLPEYIPTWNYLREMPIISEYYIPPKV